MRTVHRFITITITITIADTNTSTINIRKKHEFGVHAQESCFYITIYVFVYVYQREGLELISASPGRGLIPGHGL